MAKYHINPETGNANICTAKVKCKFTNSEGVEPPHYGTKLDAQKAAEQQLSSSLPTIPSLKNAVEIKEPVGDTRTASQIRFDITESTQKVSELAKEHSKELGDFQAAMVAYDNLPYETSQADRNKKLYEALHMTPSLGDTRKRLLHARSHLNEEHLVLQHKTDPDRADQRRKVLASLDPETQYGDELRRGMIKAFEDSEKELELSKRATDNLNNRRTNGLDPSASTMKSSWATVNDLQEQSHRMIQHARALQQLSELSKSYENLETKSLKEKIDLAPLQSTGIERLTAESMTPSQVEIQSRVSSGFDRNSIDTRRVKELEKQRESFPVGDPMRDQINQSLRDYRRDIKRNREQYFNSTVAIKEVNYKGFIKLSNQ